MKTILKEALRDIRESIGRAPQVALLGFGATNRALLDILLGVENIGITVRQAGLEAEILPGRVKIVSCASTLDEICEDVLFPSPSLRREKLSLPVGAKIINDYSLFFDKKPKRLFTVSGSDGKSTTVTMAQELLFPTFPDLFTGGNVGTPLWMANADSSAFLLELSSFTLRYATPHGGRALLTNITPNHLDWHADLPEYENTKLSLIYSADEPILSLDDAVSERAARELKAFCLVSTTLTRDEILASYKTEHTVTLESGAIKLDGEIAVTLREIKHRERHNLQNLASAIALSIGYADSSTIRKVASEYKPLKERCEQFTHHGVCYVSSSIDTTPLRTKTTLEGLGKRVRLILGGRGKGLSLEPMREAIEKYATRIAIYGEIADELCAFIEEDERLSAIPHESFSHLGEAIDYAKDGALPAETVLLSPAATSYGEFSDYAERGRFFKERVGASTQRDEE